MKVVGKISFWTCLLLLVCSCVDPVDLETFDTQTLLVVEANLTNENKRQHVLLSRSTALEDSTINRESNALVRIIDEFDETYSFSESSSGVYVSNEVFAAQINTDYRLEIETVTGNLYTSTWQRIRNESKIQNVYPELALNDEQEEGVAILVDTETSSETAYYRYEFEETFQIIAPNWSAFEADIVSRDNENPIVNLQLREQENRICFRDSLSTAIILASTDNVGSGEVVGLPLRFIRRDNYLIAHRYSILVQQYSQNVESFEFYTILRDLSSSANFFTELQPGFVAGNINAVNNTRDNVVGFFNVASVSEKRIFFNYEDVFTDGKVVQFDFPSTCPVFSPFLLGRLGPDLRRADSPVITSLDLGSIIYQETADFDIVPDGFEGPYTLVPRICGDCTVLGSNVVPEFWIE